MTAALIAETGPDEATLTTLVRRFYGQIRNDEALGPVLHRRIHAWNVHLAKMVEFWSPVAVMTGRYGGMPMQALILLPADWSQFERWLMLFHDTAERTCNRAGATHLMEHAIRTSRSLYTAIENRCGTRPSTKASSSNGRQHVR